MSPQGLRLGPAHGPSRPQPDPPSRMPSSPSPARRRTGGAAHQCPPDPEMHREDLPRSGTDLARWGYR